MPMLVLLLACSLSTDWLEHWDATWEITFRYPADWQLYTPENPGPLGYFRPNQVAACAAPADGGATFNIGVIVGAPPQPFAAKMAATFAGMSRQSGATKLASRVFDVSGHEAIEWRHEVTRATPVMIQKIVAIAGAANGFMLTCNAPKASFEALDRDVFTPLCDSVVLGEMGMASFWRQVWRRAPRAAKSASVGVGLAGIGAFLVLVLRRRPDEMRLDREPTCQ